MGNFNRGDRSGGKKRFDRGERGSRGGSSDRTSMHRAVCSECGKDCEVPFRPTGDKPVFCSVCFGNKDTSNKSRSERRSSERLSFGDKQMYRAVCVSCRKDCEVPFRPSGDKPVYCSDCFGKGERKGGGNNSAGFDQHKKQFEMLNTKLDNILRMLSSDAPAKEIVSKEKTAETAKKTIEKKTAVKKAVASKKATAKKPAEKKAVKKAAAPKKNVKKAVVKKKK